MKRIRVLLPLLITLIITFIIYHTIYKDAHLLGGLKIKYNKVELIHQANSLLYDLNVSTKGLNADASLQTDNNLIKQVQKEFGFKKGNELFRTSLPGYSWQISWIPDSETQSNFNMGNSNPNKQKNDTKIKIRYDNLGNLLEYYLAENDSVEMPTLNSDDSIDAVKRFMSRIGRIDSINSKYELNDKTQSIKNLPAYSQRNIQTGRPADLLWRFKSGTNETFNFQSERKNIFPHRIDYVYTWAGKSAYIDDSLKLEITVSGNIVSNFKISYLVPEKYESNDSFTYQTIGDIIFYIIIVILIAIIAYKKIKAYEIGFRLAFKIAVIVAVALGLNIYFSITGNFGWYIIFPVIIGPLFYAGMIFISWAVSETVTREVWNEKLNSIDILTKGYLFHTKIGESIIIGLSVGFAVTILKTFLLYIIQSFTGLWGSSYDDLLLSSINSTNTSVSLISNGILYSSTIVIIFLTFVVSSFRKKINSTPGLILLAAILWGLVNSNYIRPLPLGIIIEIMVGICFVCVYYNFDVLTSLISLLSFGIIGKTLALFSVGNAAYASSGYFLLAILIITIVYALIALFSKNEALDIEAITPRFVRNITERERLQRELEIAKEVQMSFLPHKNPEFTGLEISSKCKPALEVGGDYYDFIIINDKKIGVIIGDVSGKGTQAAFYMTLTKGFLKALSRIPYAPAEFLKELNSLFYDNVERGTFISMVYGIFDIENKNFRLARAGHNPVIVKNSFQGNVEFINSAGLALGLEKGQIFSNTIKEVEIPISSGDVLVFYTDGFTEAMNKSNVEFGEKRLVASVEKSSNLTAQQVLDNIFKDVEIFIGRANQHDDMTMVVVKVL
jgi:serine phosphatase RsbU (regulator of sigma subunit)